MLNLARWKVTLVILALIFGVLFTLPNLLPVNLRSQMPGWLPGKTLNLGLDLQGGSYLLLEVDTADLRKEKLTALIEDVRKTLRDEQIDFSDLGQVNGSVMVRVTDPAKLDPAYTRLSRLATRTASGGADLLIARAPDQRLRLTYAEAGLREQEMGAVDQSIEIIRRRIDELGTKEPSITRQGTNRIVVQAPGESDPERLKNVIGQTAKLTFQMVDDTVSQADLAAGRIPPDDIALPATDGYAPFYVVKRRALVSGEMLTDARQANDPTTTAPVVNFRFNSQGARRFGDATTHNIGHRFAIVLDNKIISAPVIQSAITGGNGQISGNFTVESANDLAVLLRAGAHSPPCPRE